MCHARTKMDGEADGWHLDLPGVVASFLTAASFPTSECPCLDDRLQVQVRPGCRSFLLRRRQAGGGRQLAAGKERPSSSSSSSHASTLRNNRSTHCNSPIHTRTHTHSLDDARRPRHFSRACPRRLGTAGRIPAGARCFRGLPCLATPETVAARQYTSCRRLPSQAWQWIPRPHRTDGHFGLVVMLRGGGDG